jgi:hypothetical protein
MLRQAHDWPTGKGKALQWEFFCYFLSVVSSGFLHDTNFISLWHVLSSASFAMVTGSAGWCRDLPYINVHRFLFFFIRCSRNTTWTALKRVCKTVTDGLLYLSAACFLLFTRSVLHLICYGVDGARVKWDIWEQDEDNSTAEN